MPYTTSYTMGSYESMSERLDQLASYVLIFGQYFLIDQISNVIKMSLFYCAFSFIGLLLMAKKYPQSHKLLNKIYLVLIAVVLSFLFSIINMILYLFEIDSLIHKFFNYNHIILGIFDKFILPLILYVILSSILVFLTKYAFEIYKKWIIFCCFSLFFGFYITPFIIFILVTLPYWFK
jgi:hypothetical protein